MFGVRYGVVENDQFNGAGGAGVISGVRTGVVEKDGCKVGTLAAGGGVYGGIAVL